MLPKTVQVLSQKYEVIEVPYFEKSQNEVVFGEIDYEKNRIKILGTLTKERKHTTLVHEIIHGILQQLGLEKENENEHLVNALAEGLSKVLTF